MIIEPLGSAMNYPMQSQSIKTSENTGTEGTENKKFTNDSVNNTPTITIKETEEADKQFDDKSGEKKQELTFEDVKSKINQVNKLMNSSEIVFGIHDETNRLFIKIVDRHTKKVIKEFPPEENLDTYAKILEMAGLLVDDKR